MFRTIDQLMEEAPKVAVEKIGRMDYRGNNEYLVSVPSGVTFAVWYPPEEWQDEEDQVASIQYMALLLEDDGRFIPLDRESAFHQYVDFFKVTPQFTAFLNKHFPAKGFTPIQLFDRMNIRQVLFMWAGVLVIVSLVALWYSVHLVAWPTSIAVALLLAGIVDMKIEDQINGKRKQRACDQYAQSRGKVKI